MTSFMPFLKIWVLRLANRIKQAIYYTEFQIYSSIQKYRVNMNLRVECKRVQRKPNFRNPSALDIDSGKHDNI